MFKPRWNRSRNLEIMVILYFRWIRLGCRNVRFCRTEIQKKIDCFNEDEFCRRCNPLFDKGLILAILFLSSGTTCFNWRGQSTWNKKMGLDEMLKRYFEKEGNTLVERWEYEWWKPYKTYVSVNEHLRESFPYKRPLRQGQLLDKIKTGSSFS